MSEQKPIGYWRCDHNGNPIWDAGCVCRDPVFLADTDDVDESGEPTQSRPVYLHPMRELTDEDIVKLALKVDEELDIRCPECGSDDFYAVDGEFSCRKCPAYFDTSEQEAIALVRAAFKEAKEEA